MNPFPVINLPKNGGARPILRSANSKFINQVSNLILFKKNPCCVRFNLKHLKMGTCHSLTQKIILERFN